jgi:hypothetical protein
MADQEPTPVEPKKPRKYSAQDKKMEALWDFAGYPPYLGVW